MRVKNACHNSAILGQKYRQKYRQSIAVTEWVHIMELINVYFTYIETLSVR